MMKQRNFSIIFILILISLLQSPTLFAQTGSLVGQILDETNDSPLWGTNILIAGTSLGTATDLDGKYRLTNISTGPHVIIFRYLGYVTDSVDVVIVENRTLELDLKMRPQIIEGEEVVISAQLQGQAAAINQQLTSNTIVNVVSKDRIQELPDANAAESIGRLPGISIERDAGEGSKVVVRGLSPKYNLITINGEKIPSTDPENRSVDLSMISSDILEGIEVYKSLTPNKDADAIGGTINFVVKKAPEGWKNKIKFQGGYNDHENDYGQYRGSYSVSNRFFDNKFGAILTGNIQKANRSSDILDVSYNSEPLADGGKRILVNNMNLGDRIETRDRYGINLALDYDLGTSSLMFSSFYGRTDRDEVRRRKRYRVGQSYTEYWLRNRQINTDLYTNSLSGKHDLGFGELDWSGSYALTQRNMPRSHDSQFRELGAFTGDLIEDEGPELIPLGAKNNLDETFFKQDFLDSDNTEDRDLTAQLNFKVPFALNNFISGYVQTGGKFRDKYRKRDKNQDFTLAFEINDIGTANQDKFNVTREGKIKIDNFYHNSFTVKNFLDGKYEFGPALDKNKLDDFYSTYRSNYVTNEAIDLEDYEAGEEILAGYIMTEINFGNFLMFLPGVRYEKTSNDYSSIVGNAVTSEGGTVNIVGRKDSLGQRSYEEFFPMVQMKIKPYSWMDIRFAVTKTLSRPDYFNLVPWERISHWEETIERGAPDLKHTISINYDAFLSFYGNYGLLTIGAFYKSLDNIAYIRQSRITDPESDYLGYDLTQPENATGETIVKGIELELQTNLTFLPSPFDGVVLNINYSKINSRTFFPYLTEGPRNPLPPFNFTFIDSARSGRMPGQPDDIANISLGYEKGKFSGRISMIYQGDALQTVSNTTETDGYTDEYVRWDLTLQYKLLDKLALIGSINNLTDLPEISYLGNEKYQTKNEIFGWTMDLGLTYKF